MNAIGRKQHIIQKLQKENYVDTNELAAELAVSAMTIRRDLNALAKSGLITVQHGGATLNSSFITVRTAFFWFSGTRTRTSVSSLSTNCFFVM